MISPSFCENRKLVSEDMESFFAQVFRVFKKITIPLLLLQILSFSYIDPIKSLLSFLLLLFTSKPHPSSIYFWKEKRESELIEEKFGLEKISSKVRLAVSQVEVEDYVFFCVASVSYATESHLVLGILGDWYLIHVSKKNILTNFGVYDDSETRSTNQIADTLRSKLERISKAFASEFD